MHAERKTGLIKEMCYGCCLQVHFVDIADYVPSFVLCVLENFLEIFTSATEFCSRNKSKQINENLAAQTRAVPALERLLIKGKRALSFMFCNIDHNFYYIWWLLKEP